MAAAGEPEKVSSGRSATMLLVVTLAAVVGLRLYLLASTDFPINDGGLFYEFIRSTAAVFPAIPERVVYNGFSLPFGYPPLGFWAGALLTKLGFDPLGIVRVLPILMNILYSLLFALLLLRSGHSRLFTALALLFFLASVRSYEWLVMGGGISRGFGSIFMLLALLAVGIPGRERRPPLPTLRLILGGAAVGGAILAHLEWGLLATVSVVTSLALGCRTIRDFIRSCLVTGATAFVLILPWIAFVVGAHGIEPFLAAGRTGNAGFLKSFDQLIWLARTNLFNLFMPLGAAVLLWRRQFFWVAFLLLCVFVTPRHGPTPAVLPLCVFSAQGVLTAFRLLRRGMPSRPVAVGVSALLVLAVLAMQTFQESEERRQVVRPLSSEQRQAMAWVRHDHPGSRFALLTPLAWHSDRAAEWFPVLAAATSTTTVQGREWLPNGDFKDRFAKVSDLKASKSCPDLLAGLKVLEPPHFIWAETQRECFQTPVYVPVFTNEGVTIFEVTRQ
jgi:hypothetical protein